MSVYDEAQWRQIADPPPLADLGGEDFMLLHRHWIWADQQKEAFDQAAAQRGERLDWGFLAYRMVGNMLLWYALLWSVIEATHDRKIDLRDPLGADIREIGELLRKCRNAVLHVSKKGDYFDRRIFELIEHQEGVELIRRVHSGLGSMLGEELQRRKTASV